MCPRCGVESETALHAFWTCSHNCKLDHNHVNNTHKNISAAVAQSEVFPCLWLRGILPSEFARAPHPQDLARDDLTIEYLNSDCAIWNSKTYYGDASGGKHTSHKNLKRRLAVVFVDPIRVTLNSSHLGIGPPAPGPLSPDPAALVQGNSGTGYDSGSPLKV